MSRPDPSLPDPSSRGKRRHAIVVVPFVLVGLFVLAWSAAWFWAKGEVAQRMDAYRDAWNRAGYRLSWQGREIGGFPFRLDVTLTEVSVREPSGWALSAPRIEGEAYMHAPTLWLVAAPAGVTFVRPEGGPVAVTGELIRASLSHLQNHPPNFSFEGTKLAFAPAPGAQPFAFSSADRAEFHLRQGPDDEGGVFLSLAGGKARPGTLLGRLAGDHPVALQWNSTMSKVSAFQGATWPDAVRHWSQAGGQMTVRNAGITAGQPLVGVKSGTLSVGSDGRVNGALGISTSQAPRAFDALAAQGLIGADVAQTAADVARARLTSGETAEAEIGFQAGRTTFGPVSLGPAPRVYDPR
ncbi:MAG: DUF2125 domain-containing protein [Proteobacteria bacterium]|nr:DUF2125 domain-containing protein [Pseudomonadota bacterium]